MWGIQICFTTDKKQIFHFVQDDKPFDGKPVPMA
jgi:hypothetical protein